MEYKGKLYGHLGGKKYFDTSHTTEEWDAMVNKIASLEAENKELIKISCQQTKQTAVQWFYDKIKSHFEHDGDLLESLSYTMEIAKFKEREQHSKTWNEAIKAHDERGHVFIRSFCDFDDYEISN
jgi:hypothetical protein